MSVNSPIFSTGAIDAFAMSNDMTRLTVRLPSDSADRLRSDLSCFTTDAARIQFLVQFYFDYKDMDSRPLKVTMQPSCDDATPTDRAEDPEEE